MKTKYAVEFPGRTGPDSDVEFVWYTDANEDGDQFFAHFSDEEGTETVFSFTRDEAKRLLNLLYLALNGRAI